MLFCKECGSQLKDGAEFCGECGHPVKTNHENHEPPAPQKPAPVPKKNMSKKAKMGIIAACIAVVVLFAAFKIGEKLMSKERLIDKFETALVKGDEKAVAKFLTTDDKKLKIDETTVKGLLKYFDKHPDTEQDLIDNLKSEAKRLDRSTSLSDDDSDALIALKKDGKFLFYDKYAIKVKGVYLNLSTNYKDTELYVDGKKVGKSSNEDFEGTYGPFVPGLHNLEAKLKTSFIDLDKKNTVFLGEEGTKQDEELYLDGNEVTINLPIEDDGLDKAELFINGKDTGLNLVKQNTFGPVLTDGSMSYSIEVHLPFGKVKTTEQPIDDTDLYADLMNDELRQTLMDTCVLNAKEWMAAYSSGDMSKFTTATGSFIDNTKSQYEDDKESRYAYKGEYLSSTFDLDGFRLFNEDGSWKANVLVDELYNSAFYYPEDGEQPELGEDHAIWEYTLIYDADQAKWLLDGQDSSYDLDSENTKEVKNDNPTVYTSNWAANIAKSE